VKILNYFYYCFFFFLCNISLRAQALVADAGLYQKICPDTSVRIGGTPTGSGGVGTLSYAWSPKASLNDSTLANPIASPTVTTIYTVFISDKTETKKDTVTIFVYNAYLYAGPDVTIQQGQTITLHAQANGANMIYWSAPGNSIYNANSFNPDVFPSSTTLYVVVAHFPGNCTVYDHLTVTVVPGNNLFFYNTFTPNGDGSNDVFYIGNIEKYPDNVLEIYNRYGQKVFTKTDYQNDWDGKYLNDELPAGTYFYVLDTKSSSGGKHKGSVTIVR